MDPHGYGGHPFPSPLAGPRQHFQPFMPPPPLPFPHQHPPPYPFLGPPPSRAHPPPIHPLGLFNPWELPSHFVPPPPDVELLKRIDKFVQYAAKNGPEFELMLRKKQRDNPAYAFLFGAEGHHYYRHRLWESVNPHLNHLFNPAMPPVNPPLAAMNPGLNPALRNLNGPPYGPLDPSLHPPPNNFMIESSLASDRLPPTGAFPPFYEQNHHHHSLEQPQLDSFFEYRQQESFGEDSPKRFKGLSGRLPTDVAAELLDVVEKLTGTKESINGAKNWFMQRSPFAPGLAEALRDRVVNLKDVDRQLYVIYLANDILFDSCNRRINPKELDNEALAFQPVLGSMLASIYHNPQNQQDNQNRLHKLLQFWCAKEVYGTDIINILEHEMVAGPTAPPHSAALHPTSSSETRSFQPPGSTGLSIPPVSATEPDKGSFQSPTDWQQEKLLTSQVSKEQLQKEHQQSAVAAAHTPLQSQSLASNGQLASSASQPSVAISVFAGYPSSPASLTSLPPVAPSVTKPSLSQLISSKLAADHTPYPHFPPGLIPGMVRKMQVGSGVPYSALSPLDIPTTIPPSTASDSYILERAAKFFKEIGEIDPLEGRLKVTVSADGGNEREEERCRVAGACIPPPANLQVDSETSTLPDGSAVKKPGAMSAGRLGIGAAADPNEVTQYDDVYASYRKQQSTSYHTYMSARAAAR